jgi:cation transport protein ChaC
MRLSERHVALLKRDIPDPGPIAPLGFRPATDDDYAGTVAAMLAARPPEPFWLFAYGSLIWKPETAFVEHQMGIARGWHRRFCLGWDYRYRGSHETPGLMMALDRGGTCKGMLYRLPEDGLEAELGRLIRREMTLVPSAFPWRFIDVATAGEPVRAMTFVMNRKSTRYVAGLCDEELADVLARACGFRGSMAEYIFQTVSMLESLGIHDRNLWRMQEMVAARIDAAYPLDQQV